MEGNTTKRKDGKNPQESVKGRLEGHKQAQTQAESEVSGGCMWVHPAGEPDDKLLIHMEKSRQAN